MADVPRWVDLLVTLAVFVLLLRISLKPDPDRRARRLSGAGQRKQAS